MTSPPRATARSSFRPEFQALNKQIGQVGTFAGILGILTIYVMTANPFL